MKPKAIEDKVRSSVAALRPLPAAVMELWELADSPTATAEQVHDVVLTDPALTAKVLRLANTAYYGLSKQVDTIRQAVIVLGMQTVKNLALGVAAFHTLKGGKRSAIPEETLWRHAMACALVSQRLAKHVRLSARDVESVFIGGLLHDLGLIFLTFHFEQEYHKVQKLERQRLTREQAEAKIFGIDHVEIGRLICAHWNFPESLTAMIAPPESALDAGDRHREMAGCVQLADYWLHLVNEAPPGLFAIDDPAPELLSWPRLKEEEQSALIAESLENLGAMQSALTAA